MDEQTARSLARDLVKKMLEPLLSIPATKKYGPLTIVELIYVGAYFTRSMVQFGFDPFDDEVYSIFGTFPPDQKRIEELLFNRILDGRERVDELMEAKQKISQLTETPGAYRRVFISLLKNAVPAGKPGRRKKLHEKDLPKLAALSDDLVPVLRGFLNLRRHSTKRSTLLDFLAADFHEQVERLVRYQQPFEKLLHDKKYLRTVKSEESRSRLIADVMAGCEFGLKPSYAVRRAKEARRAKRKGEFREKLAKAQKGS